MRRSVNQPKIQLEIDEVDVDFMVFLTNLMELGFLNATSSNKQLSSEEIQKVE